MLQKYTFFDGGTVEFDDARTVKELLAYAFYRFGYYEPFGMDVVTLFQGHHPDTYCGWFTTDVNRKCVDEIKNPDELCFAYYMPDVFYFAEGGWGHHMPTLGNHPMIPDAVALNIRFEDFDHNVVINGNYSFRDVIDMLVSVGYIPRSSKYVKVLLGGLPEANYLLSLSDEIMGKTLTDFAKKIKMKSRELQEENKKHIYCEIFEII